MLNDDFGDFPFSIKVRVEWEKGNLVAKIYYAVGAEFGPFGEDFIFDDRQGTVG